MPKIKTEITNHSAITYSLDNITVNFIYANNVLKYVELKIPTNRIGFTLSPRNYKDLKTLIEHHTTTYKS